MVNAKYIPALLLLLAATLVSCVYDDAPALRSDDGRQAVQVTFTLAAGNAPTDTRATWGDRYDSENGTAWESAIAPDDLQVLLYTTNNDYVARVENLVYFRNDDGTYTYHGQLTADADDLTPGTEYKIMVFANCGINNDTETNISTLANTTFTRDGADYIPLWGVKTTTLDLTPGLSQDLEDINLLRAMTKIEVALSDALTDEYTLSSITLNHYNTTGYCLPAGYATASQTTDLDREDGTAPISFNPNESLATNAASFTISTDGNTAVCYLPEYEAEDANPAVLTITLGNGKAYTLDLKDYTTNAYYDLVRNHIYRYTITGVNEGALTVQYRVLPWELVTSSIGWTENDGGFSLMPSGGSAGNLSSGDAEAVYCILSYPRYVEGSETRLENDRGCARFTFTLQKPEGAVWKAHLSNTEDFYFSENMNENQDYFVSNGIARTEPYTIQINPQNPWTEWENENEEESNNFNAPLSPKGQEWESNRTVPSTYFYITISVDGKHDVELKINPTNSSITTGRLYKEGRRFAGTDTRIWIRQLRAVRGYDFRDLAQNVDPTDENFDWWRINPYWGN